MDTKKIELELPTGMLEAIDGIAKDKALGFTDRNELIREGLRAVISMYG